MPTAEEIVEPTPEQIAEQDRRIAAYEPREQVFMRWLHWSDYPPFTEISYDELQEALAAWSASVRQVPDTGYRMEGVA